MFSAMGVDQLLIHLPHVEDQLDALLAARKVQHAANNVITSNCIVLLLKDAVNLYVMLNRGILRLLEGVFSMDLRQAKRSRDLYSTFVALTANINTFFDLCRSFASNLPQPMSAPQHLVDTLEQYVRSLDPSSGREPPVEPAPVTPPPLTRPSSTQLTYSNMRKTNTAADVPSHRRRTLTYFDLVPNAGEASAQTARLHASNEEEDDGVVRRSSSGTPQSDRPDFSKRKSRRHSLKPATASNKVRSNPDMPSTLSGAASPMPLYSPQPAGLAKPSHMQRYPFPVQTLPPAHYQSTPNLLAHGNACGEGPRLGQAPAHASASTSQLHYGQQQQTFSAPSMVSGTGYQSPHVQSQSNPFSGGSGGQQQRATQPQHRGDVYNPFGAGLTPQQKREEAPTSTFADADTFHAPAKVLVQEDLNDPLRQLQEQYKHSLMKRQSIVLNSSAFADFANMSLDPSGSSSGSSGTGSVDPVQISSSHFSQQGTRSVPHRAGLPSYASFSGYPSQARYSPGNGSPFDHHSPQASGAGGDRYSNQHTGATSFHAQSGASTVQGGSAGYGEGQNTSAYTGEQAFRATGQGMASQGGFGGNNTGAGSGQYSPNTGAGSGQYSANTGAGSGQYPANTGAGSGQYPANSSFQAAAHTSNPFNFDNSLF